MNAIASELINWYEENKRDLPWRHTTNPYFIWLSEVILQQTRVAQGLSYYEKFVAAFPTVHELANAQEQDVLRLWQGLGYYSRARNLHTAAKQIVNDFEGNFPNSFAEIKQLKGVGDYTAAAIASFAFQESVPVVDGNVYRVLSRLFDIKTPINKPAAKKEFFEIAKTLIDGAPPHLFNQAIMEFGALHCTPKTPNCDTCVLRSACHSFSNGTVDKRPVKQGKTKIKERHFHYIWTEVNESVLLTKRAEKDIWQGLYEPIKVEKETATKQDLEELLLALGPIKSFNANIIGSYKHILSHQHLFAHFYKAELSELTNTDTKVQQIEKKELENFPLPRLITRFLENHNTQLQIDFS